MSDTPVIDPEQAKEEKEKINTLIPIVNPLTAPELVNLALMIHNVKPGGHNRFYALHVRNDNSASSRSLGERSLNEIGRAHV